MNAIPQLAPCLAACGGALAILLAVASDRLLAALWRGWDARPAVVRGPNMTRGAWTPGKVVRHV